MENNIIAFVGIDNFDIIIYLSRVLSALGKKVLLIDHSETLSVKYSIPLPEGIDCNNDIITYRNMDFTTMKLDNDLTRNYDDILIACGFNQPVTDITCSNRVVFVTNLYRYNLLRIMDLNLAKVNSERVTKAILIKDVMETKVLPELIVKAIDRSIPQEAVTILFRDERDEANALLCHHNQLFVFSKLSRQRKSYLLKEVKLLHPEIGERQIRAAYKKAKKGE